MHPLGKKPENLTIEFAKKRGRNPFSRVQGKEKVKFSRRQTLRTGTIDTSKQRGGEKEEKGGAIQSWSLY